MDSIIEVKNIGKKYNITHQRGSYVALRDVLMSIIKSPFSFLKTKAKQVTGLETKEDFWALRNINFTVNKGEIIGIIGKNGSGKSTLLKILSQITPPTTGEIRIQGKVGSLLEVGTGFHPELTGRENIMLNGAILGMTRKEIAQKFDQIVEFAGIDKFLDTPVKYYSSGMYVRLAFSVAAHMEPDILIIDEVLAVGDAEFQKKCLGKMEEVTQQDGRTILFVSHNMAAIQQLCKKCVWLENGKIKEIGETQKIIENYLNLHSSDKLPLISDISGTGNKSVTIEKINMVNSSGEIKNTFSQNEKILLEFYLKLNVTNLQNSSSFLEVGFDNKKDERVAWISSSIYSERLDLKKDKVTFVLDQFNLVPGEYNLSYLLSVDEAISEWKQTVFFFKIIDGNFYGTGRNLIKDTGYITLNFNLN